MKPTIHFIETMSGHGRLNAGSAAMTQKQYRPPEDSDFVKSQFQQGQGRKFVMVWRDLDVGVATSVRSNEGGMRGTIDRGIIEVVGLSEQPLVLDKGEFELLPEVAPGQRRMRYQLRCHAADSQRHFTLYGFKQVERRPGSWRLWALWQDTTTLYVTIYDDGSDGQGNQPPLAARAKDIVATGIIRIYPLAFARQLLTFRSTGAGNISGPVANYLRFFRFFSGSLFAVYFGSSPTAQSQVV